MALKVTIWMPDLNAAMAYGGRFQGVAEECSGDLDRQSSVRHDGDVLYIFTGPDPENFLLAAQALLKELRDPLADAKTNNYLFDEPISVPCDVDQIEIEFQ